MSEDKDTTWGVLSHFSAFLGLMAPLGNILGPLLIWLLKKEENNYINQNVKNSLNFQITITLTIIFVLFLRLLIIDFFLHRFGLRLHVFLSIFPLILDLLIIFFIGMNFILIILGSIEASNGKIYNYPINTDFIDKLS